MTTIIEAMRAIKKAIQIDIYKQVNVTVKQVKVTAVMIC